jgi:prevent-host-death family protein
MKALGIFEIKTKLSQICDEVVRTGESVLVTKRGKPYVRINPLYETEERFKDSQVWEAREEYLKHHKIDKDLPLPERKIDNVENLFSEKDM